MRQTYLIKILILFSVFYRSTLHAHQKAVCIVPVADLVGDPMQLQFPHQPAVGYARIPLSVKKFDLICPRLHQLLFNEVVDVIDENGPELLLSIPNIFYQRQHETTKNNSFWTMRKNLMFLNDLNNKGIDLKKIPEPISFSHKPLLHQPIVSLTQPFCDPKTHHAYSVGTRFVVAKRSSQESYDVYAYSSAHQTMVTLSIPTSYCIQHNNTQQEAIDNFVALIRSWAHPSHGFIPYVLGGYSFTQLSNTGFKEIPYKGNIIYKRDEGGCPYGGMDCAGLITRGAQIVGIPFYYKNSLTIATNLKSISPDELIEPGDILWILGHVMVVSSVKDNLLVEARSYEHGYGKVHEIPLHEQFKGIYTYQDLRSAYLSQTPLQRLDKNGVVRQVVPTIKILKLSSAWHA